MKPDLQTLLAEMRQLAEESRQERKRTAAKPSPCLPTAKTIEEAHHKAERIKRPVVCGNVTIYPIGVTPHAS